MQATIQLEYKNAKIAQAIAEAISPDNFKTPSGLHVETARESKVVVTSIACNCKFATFIATIDDLLFCVSTAERTLRRIIR